ncbi:MAG: glycosyltransferase [Candidatus Dormibacteraeota bacterium]|nr:glycosyltransferase [Candidatus Dormibacteraeota bacterium]
MIDAQVTIDAPRREPPAYSGVTVVIPTRNRANLAEAAIQSVLDQGLSQVTILVSDNSTDDDGARALQAHCEGLDRRLVRYIRPPQPMPMSEHWDWVIHCALEQTGASHFLYLTDRMVFKAGALGSLIERARRFPDKVISYNVDRIDDFDQPVFLDQKSWSGKLLEIPADHLLYLTSRAVHPACLPGMLNCIVPRPLFDEIDRRFGSIFASISPDFCFAYRCLDVVNAILYYDKSLLIQYSIDRSNGLSYARGIASVDSADFLRQLSGVRMNYAAPVPEFQTITNAVLHEYCVVKQESGSSKFREIDWFDYLGATERALGWIEDPALSAEMRRLLKKQGWNRKKHYAWVLRKVAALLRHSFPGMVRQSVVRITCAHQLQPAWMWLARYGVEPPASGRFHFSSAAEAMAYDQRFPRKRARHLGHLWHLMDPPGAIREVRLDARPASARVLAEPLPQ